MGLAVADYDCDGWFDIFKTNFADDTCNLYHNNGDGSSQTSPSLQALASTTNMSRGLRLRGLRQRRLGRHHADQRPRLSAIDGHSLGQTYKNPRLVYHNMGPGTDGAVQFKDVSAELGPGISEKFSSRGAAFGDYDNDGDIDAVILNLGDSPSLLRNDGGNAQNWSS